MLDFSINSLYVNQFLPTDGRAIALFIGIALITLIILLLIAEQGFKYKPTSFLIVIPFLIVSIAITSAIKVYLVNNNIQKYETDITKNPDYLSFFSFISDVSNEKVTYKDKNEYFKAYKNNTSLDTYDYNFFYPDVQLKEVKTLIGDSLEYTLFRILHNDTVKINNMNIKQIICDMLNKIMEDNKIQLYEYYVFKYNIFYLDTEIKRLEKQNIIDAERTKHESKTDFYLDNLKSNCKECKSK